MENKKFRNKIFYTTKAEALKARRKGDRIYYEVHKGYYLIRFKKRNSIIDILNTIRKKIKII